MRNFQYDFLSPLTLTYLHLVTATLALPRRGYKTSIVNYALKRVLDELEAKE